MGKRAKREDDDDDADFSMDEEEDDEDMAAFVDEEEGKAAAKSDDEEKPAKKKQKTSKTTSKKSSKSTDNDDGKEEEKTKSKKKTTKKGDSKAKKETTTKGAAPAKKGTAKAKVVAIKSEPEARKLIYDYLQLNNRPYSIQNVIDNLHGQVKKAITQKALDKLVEQGKVTLKEQGKSKKVYMMCQDGLEVLPPEELAAIDDEIRQLKAEKQTLSDELKELQASKEKASRALTNEELDERIEQLNKDVAEQEADLLRLSTIKLATPEEKKEAQDKVAKYLKAWRERKRIAMDIIGFVSEGKNVKPRELMAELELETDEDANVNISEVGK